MVGSFGTDGTKHKDTKFHAPPYRKCAVISCQVEADLVRIGSSIWQLRIDVFLCQKHVSGSL